MGLRINQNIAALNASRNLRNTDRALSRSLERLSSGFRINRAADDPAGLIISENLRAQVAGLTQAIKNSENGVNLIKTAEASLDEVLKQLRSIRTLALDALNTGASDAVSRKADQTQISSSIATLTRIANNTQFGQKTLLDGSAGVSGTSSDESILTFVSATSLTQSGTFSVSALTAATQGEKSFIISNEFEVDKTSGGNADFAIATGGFVAFEVDFGAGLSATDAKTLGTDLTDAGLKDDTSVTGLTIRFNEQDATAYVIIDQSTGSFTAGSGLNNDILKAVNSTTLGKFLTFNEDTGAGNNLIATGNFAGLDFTLSDISIDSGNDAGTTATGGAKTATAAVAAVTSGDTVIFVIDLGTGLDTAGKAALGQALADIGVKSVTGESLTNGAGLDVTLDQATAKITIKATADGTTNLVAADIVAALSSGTSNIDRVATVTNSGTSLVVATGIAADIDDGGGDKTSGFADGDATTVTALVAAVVDDLGDGLSFDNSLAPGSQVAQGVNAVKLLRETLTFNGSTLVTVASNSLISNLAGIINQQLDSASVGVGTAFTADTDGLTTKGSTLKLTNDSFGNNSATGGKNTVTSNRESTLGFHLVIGTADVNIEGTNIVGKINNIDATGVGQTLTLNSTANSADGLAVKFVGTVDPTGLTLTVAQGSLVFQVGANAGQTVTQQLPDVRAAQLGKTAIGLETSALSVQDINVTTDKGARDALKLIDAAIDQVTTARGDLGAFQANVLESTISSLSVARENLAAAESSIRDADFADETVQFTRNQILLQAGTAILTQANAIPQAVLQLLA